MRILIVEDDPRHMAEAVSVMEAAGHEVLQATNLYEAMQHLPTIETKSYDGSQYVCWRRDLFDGVITDVHFPVSDPNWELPEGTQRGVDFTDDTDPNTPCGITVATMCDKADLPFVICTSGWHHGNRYAWIWTLCDVAKWTIVETLEAFRVPWDENRPKEETRRLNAELFTKDAPHKDWAKALEYLVEKVQAKSR